MSQWNRNVLIQTKKNLYSVQSLCNFCYPAGLLGEGFWLVRHCINWHLASGPVANSNPCVLIKYTMCTYPCTCTISQVFTAFISIHSLWLCSSHPSTAAQATTILFPRCSVLSCFYIHSWGQQLSIPSESSSSFVDVAERMSNPTATCAQCVSMCF